MPSVVFLRRRGRTAVPVHVRRGQLLPRIVCDCCGHPVQRWHVLFRRHGATCAVRVRCRIRVHVSREPNCRGVGMWHWFVLCWWRVAALSVRDGGILLRRRGRVCEQHAVWGGVLGLRGGCLIIHFCILRRGLHMRSWILLHDREHFGVGRLMSAWLLLFRKCGATGPVYVDRRKLVSDRFKRRVRSALFSRLLLHLHGERDGVWRGGVLPAGIGVADTLRPGVLWHKRDIFHIHVLGRLHGEHGELLPAWLNKLTRRTVPAHLLLCQHGIQGAVQRGGVLVPRLEHQRV